MNMVAVAPVELEECEPPKGHPYEYVARCAVRHLNVDEKPVKIYILLSGAYNALGLIGPEMNGIAILNDSRKGVVLDMEAQASSGWYPGFGGPTKKQQKRFEELATMENHAIIAWIRSHPRYRDGSL
jgi:hypothetical protein